MDELDEDQLAMLRKAFDSFDHEKTGAISNDMVGSILRMMGQSYNAAALRDSIAEIDVEKSGKIDFDGFVVLAAKFIIEDDAEDMAKELKEAFRLYDKEGNGFIPTSSLKEILRELDETLNDEDLDNIIGEIDTDGSGTVDFDEFMEMMTG